MSNLRFDTNGWLIPGEYQIDGLTVEVRIDKTPNTSGPINWKKYGGVGIIEHYTAHRNAHGSQSWLDQRKARASSTFIVGDKDEHVIWQTASLLTQTWHAGDGLLTLKGRRVNPNRCCIGIEHSCAGLLKRKGGKWLTWYNAVVPDEEVVKGLDHRGNEQAWDDFDETTIAMSAELHSAIRNSLEAKGIPFLDCWPHSFVAPHKKWDTGPNFPLEMMRSVMGGRKGEDPKTNPLEGLFLFLASIFGAKA